MPETLPISCDEAGHTGPDLLHKDQRFFAFSSVAISEEEAAQIIRKARMDNPVQMPELKAAKLLSSRSGRNLVEALLTACQGRYGATVNDKLMALCGWLFEYIFEPVFKDNPRLIYEKNLHRFVATYTYMWLSDTSSEARNTIEQFQKYMRSGNPADAPILFATPRPPLRDDGTEHPFESVLRFAYGYRNLIIPDNATLDTLLPDGGRWTLDLSASGPWSHLNHWGQFGKPLIVHCDASKPLESIVAQFTGDESDPGIMRQRLKRSSKPLGWKLAQPVAFVDSASHAAIQLADVIAGATVTFFTNTSSPELQSVGAQLMPHMLEDCILPDPENIDLSNRAVAVNAMILYELAKRAERGADPHHDLDRWYHRAEVSFARGDFHRIVRG